VQQRKRLAEYAKKSIAPVHGMQRFSNASPIMKITKEDSTEEKMMRMLRKTNNRMLGQPVAEPQICRTPNRPNN
jgi:hypothetical protein